MQCPKCGHEQEEGRAECGKCGVILAKARQSIGQARPAPTQSPKPAPVPPAAPEAAEAGQHPASMLLLGLALAAFVAAVWWLNFPSGSSPAENAYINLKHQFSLSPPAEWLQLTPENAKAIMEEYKDRFPRNLQEAIENPAFEVCFVRIPKAPDDFAPSFNVIVTQLKHDLPPLTESDKEEGVTIISGEMTKQLPGYAVESSEIALVDGLRSLRITGTAPLTVVTQKSEAIMSEPGAFGWQHVEGHTPEVTRTYDLRSIQYFVPGKKRGYIISYTGESGAFSEVEPVFSSVTTSFRVMERPPRFGPIVMGGLNGGFIGAGVYLFYIFVGRLFGLFSKGAA